MDIRSDLKAKSGVLDLAPSTLLFGGSPAIGASEELARASHAHGMPVLQVSGVTGSGSGQVNTTSTTPVDLADMTRTLTIQGTSSKVYCIVVGTFWTNLVQKAITLGILVDGSLQTSKTAYEPFASHEMILLCTALITGLSAGSHTFKVQWNCSASTTATSAGDRNFVVQEFGV